jgi:hypothetical protein
LVTDDDDPVPESADSSREPVCWAPADETDPPAVSFDDDDDPDPESADLSGEPDCLAPPADETDPPAVFFDDDGEPDPASAELFRAPACLAPPADEPSLDTSRVLFFVDPLLPVGEAGDDSDEPDLPEPVPESSAHATPGVVATAVPTPSATANAPTRPTYLAYPIIVSPSRAPNCPMSAINQQVCWRTHDEESGISLTLPRWCRSSYGAQPLDCAYLPATEQANPSLRHPRATMQRGRSQTA